MIRPISLQISKVNIQQKQKFSLNNEPEKNHQITNIGAMPYYICFKKQQPTPLERAVKYLKQAKKELNALPQDKMNIHLFDLDKLEGIQYGIEVFKGLNLKEITFIGNNLLEVAVFRGCYNNCAHCYADAKHPIKETPDQTSGMEWENFKLLTDGLKELNKRLGFSINTQQSSHEQYMTAFHDADCSQIYLKDKDGQIHDWQEIAKMLYEATGIPQLFDTAGWYLEDKAAQKRVEKYVEDILKSDNNDYLDGVFISANPYHALHFRAVEHMWKGDKTKEEEFREKDANRMANVLFTLSPVQRVGGKIYFNARAISNKSKRGEGLKEKDLIKTYDRYFKKLEKLYRQDLEGEKKVVWDESEIPLFLNNYKKLLNTILTTPSVTGRLKEIYSPESPVVKYTKKKIYNNPQAALIQEFFTMIDANGDVYITNFYETYKTELKLNFKNGDRKTRPLAPNLSEKVLTRDIIKKHMESMEPSK